MSNSTARQSKWKPIAEPRRAITKIYRQASTHWLKFYEKAVIESEARTAAVQLKSKAQPPTMIGPISQARSLPHNIQATANSPTTANKFSLENLQENLNFLIILVNLS